MYRIYFERRCVQTGDGAFEMLCREFRDVWAGGGAVVRKGKDGAEVLMIQRFGLWDLPKGHREEGEGNEDCALREVEEETGIRGLTIIRPLCVTHHTYLRDGLWHIKHTCWYEMSGSGDLIPQTEEGITQAVWVPVSEIGDRLANSYASIREVFEALERPVTGETASGCIFGEGR